MTGGFRIFVIFTIFLEAMGGGLVGPVFPSLMQKYSPGSLSDISTLIGWCAAISSISLFVCAPLVGQLADRFGRRPIILFSIAGLVVDYVICATTESLWVFLVARAVAGIYTAGCIAVQAAIIDVTPPERRARSFAIFGAGYGLGMVLGPPIGGALGRAGPEGPFWVAAILFAVDLVLGLLVLRETLPQELRRNLVLKKADPIRALTKIGRFRFGPILAVFIVMQFADTAESSVMVLFTQAKLGWNTSEIGIFYSVVGLTLFVSKLSLTPMILSRFGERRTILLGLFFHAICSAIYGCTVQGWQMYLGLSVWMIGGMAAPTVMAVMSSRVSSKEQGDYLGCILSLMVAVSAAAAVTGTNIFSYFTSLEAPISMPGATFLVSSAIFTVAWLLGLFSKNGAVALSSTVQTEEPRMQNFVKEQRQDAGA
jgi:DHA1 family tetracycline resistance protein-like MFS transporter